MVLVDGFFFFFFFNDTATTEIYTSVNTLSLHDALPISTPSRAANSACVATPHSNRVRSSLSRSEEHTSELQSLTDISYAVFCLKNKNELVHGHARAREQLAHRGHRPDAHDARIDAGDRTGDEAALFF